jgi:hypothetical protein
LAVKLFPTGETAFLGSSSQTLRKNMADSDLELEDETNGDDTANGLEFANEDDAALGPSETAAFSEAVLYSSDWTVETVISQLKNKNIEMNPRFQRRDAWRSIAPGGNSSRWRICRIVM